MGGARERGGGQKRVEKGDEVEKREEGRGVDHAEKEEEESSLKGQ